MDRDVFRRLDLAAHRNNVGLTTTATIGSGSFNIWRNSIPAEELPVGRDVVVDGIPFAFPPAGHGEPDNVRCEGQLITVPVARYDWLYLLVSAERRVEDELAFHFADASVDFEPLRVSDFWVAPPAFGESAAYVTSAMHYPRHVQRRVPATIWCQRVPVVRRYELRAVRLPHNVAVHVFAATFFAREVSGCSPTR